MSQSSTGTPQQQESTVSRSRTGPQNGILNRPPEHLLVAALKFAGSPDPQACREALEKLREVLRRELQSDLDPVDATTDRTAVALETGELGFEDRWDRQHLTVTVGFSASGYDALGLPVGHADRPVDLVATPWSDFGESPVAPEDGDILLHVNSDNLYVAEHVLRRVEHTLSRELETVWALQGAQRYGSRAGRVAAGEARALIGFHDGLANLDPAHNPEDASLVFIDPQNGPAYPPNPAPGQQPAAQPGQAGYGTPQGNGPSFPALRPVPVREPDSATGGTYVLVRGSVFDTHTWDEQPLGQQEQMIGRHKPSGAFLDRDDSPAQRDQAPAYETEPADLRVPLNSHVRRSNPRATPEDRLRRIFRRGYPMMVPMPGGSLRRGLLFVSFSRSLTTQIEFIMRAWLRNPDFPTVGAGIDPLLQLDTEVLAGGYYFVPPLTDSHKPWSWRVPAV